MNHAALRQRLRRLEEKRTLLDQDLEIVIMYEQQENDRAPTPWE
jgi:hypothetical protein